MGKNKTIIIAVSVLIVAVVLTLLFPVKSPKPPGQVQDASSTSTEGFDKKSLVALMAPPKEQESYFPTEWGSRNPFDTTGASSRKGLSGVFLGSDKPSAIIDDVVIGIGQKVGDFTVKEITQETVKLISTTGEEKMLKMQLPGDEQGDQVPAFKHPKKKKHKKH